VHVSWNGSSCLRQHIACCEAESFDATGGDEGVEVGCVDAYVLAEFGERDATFGDEPADEPCGGAKPFGGLFNVQQCYAMFLLFSGCPARVPGLWTCRAPRGRSQPCELRSVPVGPLPVKWATIMTNTTRRLFATADCRTDGDLWPWVVATTGTSTRPQQPKFENYFESTSERH
jgi:hypothetical protein